MGVPVLELPYLAMLAYALGPQVAEPFVQRLLKGHIF